MDVVFFLKYVVQALIVEIICVVFFFFSSRRRHTRLVSDWSSDVCSSDLVNRGLLLNMKPAIYVPVTQVKRPGADYLVVRTSQDPLAMVNALRSAVWSVDNEIGRASCRERV